MKDKYEEVKSEGGNINKIGKNESNKVLKNVNQKYYNTLKKLAEIERQEKEGEEAEWYLWQEIAIQS